jgi:hypothetical protein
MKNRKKYIIVAMPVYPLKITLCYLFASRLSRKKAGSQILITTEMHGGTELFYEEGLKPEQLSPFRHVVGGKQVFHYHVRLV